MGGGFNVDGDDIGAGLGEICQVTVGRLYHEVDVQEGAVLVGQGAQGADDDGADGDVGYKMAVHDVDVNILCSGAQGFFNLAAQLGEICGEYGGGEFYFCHELSTDTNGYQQITQIIQISWKTVICVICVILRQAQHKFCVIRVIC